MEGTTEIEMGANRIEDQTEDQVEIRMEMENLRDVEVDINQTTNIRERTSLSAGELGAPSSHRVKGSLSAVPMA